MAQQLREQTQRGLTGNPWVQMTLASNLNNVINELHAVLRHSDLSDMAGKPDGLEWDAALSMTLGKDGCPPPWAPRDAAAWQIRQIGKLLRQAEVVVISPAAHAAVMAAAATLEPADISTLDRDRDILVQAVSQTAALLVSGSTWVLRSSVVPEDDRHLQFLPLSRTSIRLRSSVVPEDDRHPPVSSRTPCGSRMLRSSAAPESGRHPRAGPRLAGPRDVAILGRPRRRPPPGCCIHASSVISAMLRSSATPKGGRHNAPVCRAICPKWLRSSAAPEGDRHTTSWPAASRSLVLPSLVVPEDDRRQGRDRPSHRWC
ncbi:hypothetical protein ABT147_36265 [Streptomyces sp. NPDC001868]|uniref:hypothetical protein n=1 Tax=Streptomyces sp. NPDC001868 TaxID=3154401 RepID=UPI003321843C